MALAQPEVSRVRYTNERLEPVKGAARPVQAWELGEQAGSQGILEAKEFAQIKPGSPLLIEIREIYTGRDPGLGAVTGNPKKKNLLVTTAVRGWAENDASVRAVNCITEDRVGPRSHLLIPGALNKGTSVVYYSPAILLDSLTVRFEMVFDEFESSTIEAVANGFAAAGGLPVFMPYAGYLLAASSLLKLVSNVGDKLLDKKPFFAREKAVNLNLAGVTPTKAGFYLLAPEDRSIPQVKELWESYSPNADGELRHLDTDERWRGDYPYVLYTIDGSSHDEQLGSWAATALTADEIERFYSVKNLQAEAVNLFVDGLKSYNNLDYWNKARKTKAQLVAESDPVRKTALEQKLASLLANILDSDLRGTV